MKNKKNDIALYSIDKNFNLKSYSYSEIDNLVNRFCNFILFKLKKINSKSKVMIHSSAGIESSISMLACAKLGIEFSVLFEELDKIAIEKRINLFKPNLFITKKKKSEVKFLKKKNEKKFYFI